MEQFISYEEMKEEFEEYNFKIRNPLLYVEINKQTGELIERTKKEFTDTNENIYYNDVDKKCETQKYRFVDKWMKDEHNISYNNFDCLPCEKTPEYMYNTFDGYYSEKQPNTKNYEHSFFFGSIIKMLYVMAIIKLLII